MLAKRFAEDPGLVCCLLLEEYHWQVIRSLSQSIGAQYETVFFIPDIKIISVLLN